MVVVGRRQRVLTLGDGIFFVAFGLYATALFVWLLLGLVPTLVDHLGGLQHLLTTLASSHHPFAGVAERMVDHSMMSSSGEVAMQYLFSLLNVALALVLIALRPFERVPRLLAFALLGTAATFNVPSHEAFHVIGKVPFLTTIHFSFHIISGVAYLWAVVLFPDGTLPGVHRKTASSKWIIGLVAFVTTGVMTFVSWRGSFLTHLPFFIVFFGILTSVVAISAQTIRIRTSHDVVIVQQSRLLRAAFLPAFAFSLLWVSAWLISKTNSQQTLNALHLEIRLEHAFPAVFALVPAVLFVGILRYRLWNVDMVLSKGLLYGSIGGVVAIGGIFAIVVVGQVFHAGLVVVLLVMSVVALGVDAIRGSINRTMNRMVFGQDMSPSEALVSLAVALEQQTSESELLELTRVVVHATRASKASVWLAVDGQSQEVATWPADFADTLAARSSISIPIGYQEQTLGRLELVLPKRMRLSKIEHQLVGDLAYHAGLLCHNTQLSTELAAYAEQLEEQSQELRRSRQTVVEAQDAERRRIERDLHDGAQQELVALLITLKSLNVQALSGKEFANRLRSFQAQIDHSGEQLQSLCEGGVPEKLRLLGLNGAVIDTCQNVQKTGVMVKAYCTAVDDLPLDVQTALYFSCHEALQNAMKHANATEIKVMVQTASDNISFEVTDNGVGVASDAIYRSSGLKNIDERLSMFGGSVVVVSEAGHGTKVLGSIPGLLQVAEGV